MEECDLTGLKDRCTRESVGRENHSIGNSRLGRKTRDDSARIAFLGESFQATEVGGGTVGGRDLEIALVKCDPKRGLREATDTGKVLDRDLEFYRKQDFK